jgi:hypothetical protein
LDFLTLEEGTNKYEVILTVHRRQYVEIKCQLDATDDFIADLIACSPCFRHHYAHRQELGSIIQVVAVCGIGALVFKSSVWCGAEGCVSGLRAAATNRTHNPQLHTIQTT